MQGSQSDAHLHNAEALLRGSLASHPQCPMAHNNLALVLVARGRLSLGGGGGLAELYAGADAALAEASRNATAGSGLLRSAERNRRLLGRLMQVQ